MICRTNKVASDMSTGIRAACGLMLLLATLGCGSGPAAIQAVSVDIDEVAEQLMAEFDKDSSGGLSQAEIEAAPPIADRMARFDIDRNGEIILEELTKNLARIFDPESALVGATCVVRRNGQPLSGAEVRFIPLDVLKDVVPAADGVTDSNGAAMISAAREELPDTAPNVPGLMRPGLYLVEVTHKDFKIPDKYNRQTILGKEISGETVFRGNIVVDLKI
jgi:hypothetical protein